MLLFFGCVCNILSSTGLFSGMLVRIVFWSREPCDDGLEVFAVLRGQKRVVGLVVFCVWWFVLFVCFSPSIS